MGGGGHVWVCFGVVFFVLLCEPRMRLSLAVPLSLYMGCGEWCKGLSVSMHVFVCVSVFCLFCFCVCVCVVCVCVCLCLCLSLCVCVCVCV